MMLRVAVAAREASEAAEVAGVWMALDAASRRRKGSTSRGVRVEVVPWPVAASMSTRHHLVVGIRADTLCLPETHLGL